MIPFIALKYISFVVFVANISVLALLTALIRWNYKTVYTQFKDHLKMNTAF